MNEHICPYCETLTVHIVHDPREHGYDNWAACCYNCGLQTPIRKTEHEACAAFLLVASAARLARSIEALERRGGVFELREFVDGWRVAYDVPNGQAVSRRSLSEAIERLAFLLGETGR